MGVEHTPPSLVSRALKLEIGAPVNLAAWNEARRRLYETGAFRSVDIEREVVEEPVVTAAAPGPLLAEPVRALVNVQEWPRYRFRYGVELNDTAQSGDPSDACRRSRRAAARSAWARRAISPRAICSDAP